VWYGLLALDGTDLGAGVGGRKEKRKGAAIERTHQVLNVAKSVRQAGAQHDLAVHDQRRLAVV
jgi:hypothetical protein